MRADAMATILTLEMQAHRVPRVYWCPMAAALESMLRDAKGRGGLLQRIGLALALEAVKSFRARECAE